MAGRKRITTSYIYQEVWRVLRKFLHLEYWTRRPHKSIIVVKKSRTNSKLEKLSTWWAGFPSGFFSISKLILKKTPIPNVISFMYEGNAEWTAHSDVWQGYIYEVSVILHDNLHRESHKLHVPHHNSVTWLQRLHKPTNTGASTALNAETQRSTRTRIRVLSRNVTSG